jgi:DNA-binding LacI/PurR family transcriptional regulator
MSDVMAIGAIGAAGRLGRVVPADLSVVGFDDIELARHVQPPLTTVHQPVRRKGEEACRLLLAAIERQDTAGSDHRRLETRLIVRGSSGPAPGWRQEVAGGH